ncbi:MAG: FixH family protein [candidate division Zixibacteria bacterium]|nr:FixH family protein [candidate division Zixibacteria bacterium]
MMNRLRCFAVVSAFLIAVSPTLAAAHGDEEEETTTADVSVSVTPTQAIQGDTVPIEAFIASEGQPVTGVTVTFSIDRHEVGIADAIATTERAPGRYVALYTFTESGNYEVHVGFTRGGAAMRTTAPIEVIGGSLAARGWLFLGAVAALAAVAIGMGAWKHRMKAGLIGAGIIVVVSGLGYSLYVTYQSGAATRGIVTPLADGTYIWTAHVHAYVPIFICGEEYRLPTEVGALTGPHTHEEKNTIHWHDKLPYDVAAQKILDTKPLALGAFFSALDVPFGPDQVTDTVSPGTCGGKPATLKMFVSGKSSDAWGDYVWRDRDVIAIFFDERTASDIEGELKARPITFPALGRG